MGDFAQTGPVPTLHRLGPVDVDALERQLVAWSASSPMALIIPTLYDELDRRALPTIVEELAGVPYLDEVIIGVDGADADQFARAREFFAGLPMRHRLLWNDGPRLREIDDQLRKLDLAPAQPGKGRNVWYCLGYYLASGRADVVALHDADILTYSRAMLARLFFPVASPDFGYAFAKGYYYRTDAETLNGRVARLLVAPLLRALRTVTGPSGYLDHLAGFRYPLAGEFAMKRPLAADLRIPADWGVEIGVLGEVYRRLAPSQICQVDIADAYDHKHQPLSVDNPGDGLHRMAIDVTGALLRRLNLEGTVLDAASLRSVEAAYQAAALDLVETYHNDAVINGLATNRHEEEETVELFAGAVAEAGRAVLSGRSTAAFSANWTRVTSAVPDVYDQLLHAVEADAEE
ncbi:MAG: glycosyl transferase [Actinomycetota bacterium]